MGLLASLQPHCWAPGRAPAPTQSFVRSHPPVAVHQQVVQRGAGALLPALPLALLRLALALPLALAVVADDGVGGVAHGAQGSLSSPEGTQCKIVSVVANVMKLVSRGRGYFGQQRLAIGLR